MTIALRKTMDGVIEAIESKDVDLLLNYFADDAVLFDPHFPVSNMEGKSLIRCSYNWAFLSVKELCISIEREFTSSDGQSGVFELRTKYRSQTGRQQTFFQMFILEMKNDKILRLQVYTPSAPKNNFRPLLSVSRLIKRLFRRDVDPGTPVYLK